MFTIYKKNIEPAEFESYLRLLTRRNINIGNCLRTLHDNRFLHVWASKSEAEEFVNKNWLVKKVRKVSIGPLGPLQIQLLRESTGLKLALSLLSKRIIQTYFKDAVILASLIYYDISLWHEYEKTNKAMSVVRKIVPGLTGLNSEEIRKIGYEIVDLEANKIKYYSEIKLQHET